MFHHSSRNAPGQSAGASVHVQADEAISLFTTYARALAEHRFKDATGPHKALLALGFSVLWRPRPPRGGGR